MEETDLKNLWQSHDHKLATLLEINKKQLKELQGMKAQSSISSFTRNHVFVMLAGVVWVLLLIFLVYHVPNPYFKVSVGFIILFNVFAVLLYLRHIFILLSIDVAGSITETQAKLSRVYTSYVQSGRVLLLQAPFYCTWWYTNELVQNGSAGFWLIQLVIVSAFTFVSVFLFRKLSLKNKAGNWARNSNRIFGAEKLQQAIAFLDEIRDFKNEK